METLPALFTGDSSSRVVKWGGGEGGEYWPRFAENKMAVSHFTFHEKNNVFRHSVFLTLVNNYNQRTALFDVLGIFPLLMLWKGNQVLCLEVEAWHHLLLIQNHCHQRSRHLIQRAGLAASEIPNEDPPFLSSSCGTSLSSFCAKSNCSPPRIAVSYMFRGRVPALNLVVSCL